MTEHDKARLLDVVALNGIDRVVAELAQGWERPNPNGRALRAALAVMENPDKTVVIKDGLIYVISER